VQWTAPDVAEAVDRRVVASPEQVRALLDAVPGQPRQGWGPSSAACTTQACARPKSSLYGQATASCQLSAGGDFNCGVRALGWPRPDRQRRGSRSSRAQASGLQRVRIVPIPPELVDLLRAHLEYFGTGDARRVFSNERGRSLRPVGGERGCEHGFSALIITAALAAGQHRETLPAAPGVDTAAQPNPRTRRGAEPAR
jgi:hypothetical protein